MIGLSHRLKFTKEIGFLRCMEFEGVIGLSHRLEFNKVIGLRGNKKVKKEIGSYQLVCMGELYRCRDQGKGFGDEGVGRDRGAVVQFGSEGAGGGGAKLASIISYGNSNGFW